MLRMKKLSSKLLASSVKIEKNDLLLMGAGCLGLILHLTGICSLHWIECHEWWKIKDQHSHIQNVYSFVQANQGLYYQCCRSADCYGKCEPIDFTELLHGELIQAMDKSELFLYNVRKSSILFFISGGFALVAILFVPLKIKGRLIPFTAFLFTISGLITFFGLSTYASVSARYRSDEFTLGISFYSCLFGMLIHEALAVIILQNFHSVYVDSTEEAEKEQTLEQNLSYAYSDIPEYLKNPARRQSYTHIGAIRTPMPRRMSMKRPSFSFEKNPTINDENLHATFGTDSIRLTTQNNANNTELIPDCTNYKCDNYWKPKWKNNKTTIHRVLKPILKRSTSELGLEIISEGSTLRRSSSAHEIVPHYPMHTKSRQNIQDCP